MPPARWFSTILLVLVAALPAAGSVCAQGGGSNYTVDGVDVDVNAPDALQARQLGIVEARRKAARMLADRLVTPEERARVAVPDDARLESMVRGIEFVNERSAPGRYIATLNVVFSPDAVKGWLGGSGARVGETVQRAALVIPLWKGRAGVEPLGDRNAWRDAWQALDTKGSAVPVTMLRADQLDQG